MRRMISEDKIPHFKKAYQITDKDFDQQGEFIIPDLGTGVFLLSICNTDQDFTWQIIYSFDEGSKFNIFSPVLFEPGGALYYAQISWPWDPNTPLSFINTTTGEHFYFDWSYFQEGSDGYDLSGIYRLL